MWCIFNLNTTTAGRWNENTVPCKERNCEAIDQKGVVLVYEYLGVLKNIRNDFRHRLGGKSVSAGEIEQNQRVFNNASTLLSVTEQVLVRHYLYHLILMT